MGEQSEALQGGRQGLGEARGGVMCGLVLPCLVSGYFLRISLFSREFMKLAQLLSLTAMITAASAFAAPAPLLDIPVKDIEGKETTLSPHAGKVLLVVNVASKCGNTPQYAELQALYEKYKEAGLVVLGFPCNDFGKQEPGTNAEIAEFCSTKYRVTFPMYDKVHVKGPEQHALYGALTGKEGAFPGDVKWNFGKFLIGRDGKAMKRIEPGTEVTDADVVKVIEAELAKK